MHYFGWWRPYRQSSTFFIFIIYLSTAAAAPLTCNSSSSSSSSSITSCPSLQNGGISLLPPLPLLIHLHTQSSSIIRSTLISSTQCLLLRHLSQKNAERSRTRLDQQLLVVGRHHHYKRLLIRSSAISPDRSALTNSSSSNISNEDSVSRKESCSLLASLWSR